MTIQRQKSGRHDEQVSASRGVLSQGADLPRLIAARGVPEAEEARPGQLVITAAFTALNQLSQENPWERRATASR